MTTKTKKSHQLTLKDILSRLDYPQVVKLLGEEGTVFLRQGAQYEIDVDNQVYLRGDLFRLKLPCASDTGDDVLVTIAKIASSRQRLHWKCDACDTLCQHVGAAFSLVLEDKYALGLSALPAEHLPMELLSEELLYQRAIAERAERAKKEKYRLQSSDPSQPWTDYTITSALSGKSYRVALRGEERGESYCSCPDFRTNTLGTCKHILYALDRVRRKFSSQERDQPYERHDLTVYVRYDHDSTLRLGVPRVLPPEVASIVRSLRDRDIDDVHDLVRRLAKLERAGVAYTLYPDAEEWIQQRMFQDRIAAKVAEIRQDPARHPLRTELLKAELLPYQLDGIAFAVGAGRAILADDMGLGKTIQGVGVAEFLAREAEISRVLVICPTSLKSQWRNEIQRFSHRDCQLVMGRLDERAEQYDNDSFFTICNYEQVLRDILAIEQVPWDLIILDEGQRIKNWEAKTSHVVKSLKPKFALVLSGTPLENRLDELYSVVQFIDDRRLGPGFRFFHRHRVVDENGKVIAYKNLDELREKLRPILLRRTRDMVLKELPPRTTEVMRIPPTDEQLMLHRTHMQIVSTITRKKFLTEMDLLRLQKALLMCRMCADSTFLLTKEHPSYSTKLTHLDGLLDQLFQESGRKVVLFSEWTKMLDLIQPMLERRGLNYVRLDGSVPQKKRQQLVHEFQENSECKLFITTNAGSTGLNLQAADTVINVDLPWNPAVLEQRIARAHRMGQRRPVQVFILVTEDTLEENLLYTLSTKHDLALAALDVDSEVSQVDFVSGIEEMKRRLEVLLGAKPEAAVDVTTQNQAAEEAARFAARRERVAAAGGEMLGAVFQFLGELVSQEQTFEPSSQVVESVRSRLADCVEEDEAGRQRLSITLPNRDAMNNLATTLAKLLAQPNG